MTRLYKASENGNELILTERQLTRQDAGPRTVSRLNKAGWLLGSGHEKVEILDRDLRSYVLLAVPFHGAPTQYVNFKFFKEI